MDSYESWGVNKFLYAPPAESAATIHKKERRGNDLDSRTIYIDRLRHPVSRSHAIKLEYEACIRLRNKKNPASIVSTQSVDHCKMALLQTAVNFLLYRFCFEMKTMKTD